MFAIYISVAAVAESANPAPMESSCDLSPALKAEIKSYAPIVELIKRNVVDENGPLKNKTWTNLANFVDDFGSRLAGTKNLENAIDFLLRKLAEAKLDNVHGEDVVVPRWVR